MGRLTFNAAMQQFHEQFPRIAVTDDEPPMDELPDGRMEPMPWDEEAEDMG